MKKCLPPVSIFVFLIALSISYAAMAHYSTENYVLANVIKLNENTVIIGVDCKAIVAETSPERALSIERGINGILAGRPMTHDTFIEVLKSFNISIEALKFQSYDNEYYYAVLILDRSSVNFLEVRVYLVAITQKNQNVNPIAPSTKLAI